MKPLEQLVSDLLGPEEANEVLEEFADLEPEELEALFRQALIQAMERMPRAKLEHLAVQFERAGFLHGARTVRDIAERKLHVH